MTITAELLNPKESVQEKKHPKQGLKNNALVDSNAE